MWINGDDREPALCQHGQLRCIEAARAGRHQRHLDLAAFHGRQ
jgi:hypothetical protein